MSWFYTLVKIIQQKPADLDLLCFQNSINLGSAGQGLTMFIAVKIKTRQQRWFNTHIL